VQQELEDAVAFSKRKRQWTMQAFDRHRDLPQEIDSAITCSQNRNELRLSRWRSLLEFGYASSILDQLYFCNLMSPNSTTIGVSFDHNVGPGYEGEIQLLANVLESKICPLGTVGGSSGILLISEDQYVFMLGCHASGVLYVGHGLGQSLQRLTESGFVLPWLVISPELDPGGVFESNNGPLEKGTLVVHVRHSEPFVPLVTRIS
jgi:hypothetical protein